MLPTIWALPLTYGSPPPTGLATTQIHHDPAAFEARVEDAFAAGCPLVEGYAPFCKHVFIENFCNVRCGYTKITDDNRGLIKSGYTLYLSCASFVPFLPSYLPTFLPSFLPSFP